MELKRRYQLRPVMDKDTDFLYRVYASTREAEMACTGWDAAQTELFLRFQFALQNNHYRTNYHLASFEIICSDDQQIGRLYSDRSGYRIRIIEIALLPEYRNMGIGTEILRSIIGEADRTCRPITLSVVLNNPAVLLYRRLGFEIVSDDGVYYSMEYPSSTVFCTNGTLYTSHLHERSR